MPRKMVKNSMDEWTIADWEAHHGPTNGQMTQSTHALDCEKCGSDDTQVKSTQWAKKGSFQVFYCLCRACGFNFQCSKKTPDSKMVYAEPYPERKKKYEARKQILHLIDRTKIEHEGQLPEGLFKFENHILKGIKEFDSNGT